MAELVKRFKGPKEFTMILKAPDKAPLYGCIILHACPLETP